MEKPQQPQLKRRGAQINPPNRFEAARSEADYEHLEFDEDLRAPGRAVPTQFLPDLSKSIVSRNDSPDIPFEFSVNPYRGCEHGCSYCYARPTHETLAMNAGSDFESKIMVKHEAPQLLRVALQKKSWRPAPVTFSGVTDCYQPAERRFRLTRACLEVLFEFRNPATIITKNVLVLRDLPLLSEMARYNLVKVFVSITTLDAELARQMEPRTPEPKARFEAVRRLNEAGVPAGIMMAPIIPGLTDHEIPAILAAASAANARSAGYTIVRLPHAVRPIFLDWLERTAPLKAARVTALLREMRGGELNDPNFSSRMRGEGPYAQAIANSFRVFKKKFGLDQPSRALDTSQFRPNGLGPVQLELFR